jgi:hypothetical protein
LRRTSCPQHWWSGQQSWAKRRGSRRRSSYLKKCKFCQMSKYQNICDFRPNLCHLSEIQMFRTSLKCIKNNFYLKNSLDCLHLRMIVYHLKTR